MSHRRRAGRALAGIGLLAVAAVASAGPAGAATHAISQFTIKSPNNQPGDMTIGNDGNVWFVDQATSKIARVTRAGGIAGFLAAKASHPVGITTGSDGAVWFTETAVNKVARTVSGSTITQIALPTTGVNAVKSPRGITAGPDGNLYVVGFSTNDVARINVGTPHTVTKIASLGAGKGPVRITTGSDGNLWVTETTSHQVARVTPGGAVTQFTLPAKSAPSRIVSGPDGNLWVTEPGTSRVAVITTSGTISQIGIAGKPTGITSGADNFMWATLQTGTGGNAIARIPLVAPRTVKKFTVPTAKSLPSGITVGDDGNIWFSETAGNKIGRLADAPGHTSFVAVNDHGYAPASQGIALQTGKNHTPTKVEWLFRGAKNHSVVDSTGTNLFSSGSIAPGANFSTTFGSAGTFTYHSTVGGDTMTGTIKVTPSAVLSNGNIVVSVGNSAMGGGVTCDVQVETPGGSAFTIVGNNVGTQTFTYNPGAHGVYKFQVRTNNGGGTSGWSPSARVTF
jgi:virginiamycin B lyase